MKCVFQWCVPLYLKQFLIFKQKPITMNRKCLLFPAFLLLLLNVAMSQTLFEVSPCFHDEVLKYQSLVTPDFKNAVDRTYESLLKRGALQTRGDKLYTINVVVHVVYNADEENISDTRIKDQIMVLTESYRRKNSDTTNTRAIFKPVAADANIEFKLDRIVRVKTTTLFKPNILSQTDQIPNQVKQSDKGGSNAIDPDRYLNVWVCKIQPLELLSLQLGQVLGFAYPPAGLTNWPDGASAPSKNLDGVVVDFRTVGKEGLVYNYPDRPTPLLMQGRTLVHEVGHYLGLRHIWGDGSLLGSSCNGEDGIADTPKASSQSKFDCDKTKNSCPDTPNDLPDMIENYMDYSEESCMNMFTKGQVGMIRSVLEGPRKLLIEKSLRADDIAHFKVTLSPNPTNGTVYLDWNEKEPYQVRVYDTYGRLVEKSINQSSQSMNVTSYNNGLYFFEIKSNNRFQVLKCIVAK
jgi:Pregnancy-associated plasma protein-A/Secretion system C-terminal sorting domain